MKSYILLPFYPFCPSKVYLTGKSQGEPSEHVTSIGLGSSPLKPCAEDTIKMPFVQANTLQGSCLKIQWFCAVSGSAILNWFVVRAIFRCYGLQGICCHVAMEHANTTPHHYFLLTKQICTAKRLNILFETKGNRHLFKSFVGMWL